jgi:hypothetical protein
MAGCPAGCPRPRSPWAGSPPEEGQFPVPATTPCTFTITLAGGGPPPASAAPGKTVTLTISAVLPTGNGQLQWAPQGGRPVVSWDFDVEID